MEYIYFHDIFYIQKIIKAYNNIIYTIIYQYIKKYIVVLYIYIYTE